jgi:D-alanyl-D-alanine carboxypeptidase (penicillin-binding protein 5/6)
MMLVASANDAAAALAIHVSGSEKAHVRAMNKKAAALGLKHTKAIDAHGLSKREHSSAGDLAIIGRRVLANPTLRKIVRMRSVAVPRRGGGHDHYRSTNRLLGSYRGMQGVKTGFTNPAGYCLVGSAKRGKIELVGVVLGAGSNAGRFAEMRKLLDWGFAHTHMRTLVSRDATIGVTPTSVESSKTVIVAHPSKTVEMALLDGSSKVKRVVKKPTVLTLPVKAGQRVGTAEFYQGSTRIATVPLLSVVSVSRPATPSVPPTSSPPPSTD